VTFTLTSLLSVLSNEVSALTVTDSVAEPTSSVTSTRTVCVACTVMFWRTNFLNPGTATVSSYSPTGICGRV
jgi:hypothetical protein